MFDKIRQVMGLTSQSCDEQIVTKALQEEGNTVVHKTLIGKAIHYFTVMFQEEEA